MRDNSFVRGIRGPIGSGKSVACCIELFRRANEQHPGNDGIRRSRYAVIRNTNPELRTTTIATWLSWFPENEWGAFRWSPPFTHHIKRGDVDMEVLFIPLDTAEDVRKLLSLELSGVFCNEARELPKSIIDGATSRVDRFPSKKDGVGCTHPFVIMDTNAPEEDHWWPIMSGEVPTPEYISAEESLMLIKPDNWKFFTQPSAMNEKRNERGDILGYDINAEAENLENVGERYYNNLIRGKTKSWIDVYVLNRLGTIQEGKPVYEGWKQETHVAREPLEASELLPVVCGIDFGLSPAAVFLQRTPSGRWLCLAELVSHDMGARRFGEVLRLFSAEHLPDMAVEFFGDPAGDFRAQTDETTPFEILRTVGVKARPAPSNDPVVRIEAVNGTLARLVDGEPGFLLDGEKCPVLKAGFEGGYHYRRLQVSGERFDDRPHKNRFSHVHDALQYALLGAGEGKQVLRGGKTLRPVVAQRRTDIFSRRRAMKKGKPRIPHIRGRV